MTKPLTALRRGFSLLELVVVLAILGIVLTVAIHSLLKPTANRVTDASGEVIRLTRSRVTRGGRPATITVHFDDAMRRVTVLPTGRVVGWTGQDLASGRGSNGH